MASELCPKCRQLQNARVTVSTRTIDTPEGETKQVKTRSLHCEVCGSFIRSEDEEEPAKGE